MIISLVNRDDVPRITRHIEETNPEAFFSIEDVGYVNQGVFRPRNTTRLPGLSMLLQNRERKHKTTSRPVVGACRHCILAFVLFRVKTTGLEGYEGCRRFAEIRPGEGP